MLIHISEKYLDQVVLTFELLSALSCSLQLSVNSLFFTMLTKCLHPRAQLLFLLSQSRTFNHQLLQNQADGLVSRCGVWNCESFFGCSALFTSSVNCNHVDPYSRAEMTFPYTTHFQGRLFHAHPGFFPFTGDKYCLSFVLNILILDVRRLVDMNN